MTQQHYDAFDRFTIETSGCRAPIFTPKCVAAMVVLRQPNKMEASCCHVATSERRRIHSRADYCCIALREASIRRSQRGNNSATPHTLSTTFAATPLSTYLSCVETARRYRLNILSLMSFTCAARASFVLISSLILSRACITVVWSRPPKYSPMDTRGILCPRISQIR